MKNNNENIVRIEVKRSGFPVVIGDTELYFDSSVENLKKFLELDDLVDKKTAELQKILEAMSTDDETEQLAKEYTKAEKILYTQGELSWDTTFGEGTFEKLYKKHPDLWALSDAFEATAASIGERIKELADERRENVDKIKQEALEKKAQKQSDK